MNTYNKLNNKNMDVEVDNGDNKSAISRHIKSNSNDTVSPNKSKTFVPKRKLIDDKRPSQDDSANGQRLDSPESPVSSRPKIRRSNEVLQSVTSVKPMTHNAQEVQQQPQQQQQEQQQQEQQPLPEQPQQPKTRYRTRGKRGGGKSRAAWRRRNRGGGWGGRGGGEGQTAAMPMPTGGGWGGRGGGEGQTNAAMPMPTGSNAPFLSITANTANFFISGGGWGGRGGG